MDARGLEVPGCRKFRSGLFWKIRHFLEGTSPSLVDRFEDLSGAVGRDQLSSQFVPLNVEKGLH
jgi:hypothetical protein